jgi:hypothetical protein
VVFGAAVGAAYGLLVLFHVVFGLFFALIIVCGLRFFGLYVLGALRVGALARTEHGVASVGGRSAPLPVPAAAVLERVDP